MKVIHVAGWSGSGKTTFICDLVAALTTLGKVGTIKHIGDHVCDLPTGKDTSVHYDAGASLVTGIDCEKTMITCRTVSLTSALDQLSDNGVMFAVVEGFKKIPFRKVVIGDLDVPALIRNPHVDDVISLLSSFDDYYTLDGLVKEIDENSQGIYTMASGDAPCALSIDTCSCLEDEAGSWDGISGIRIRIQRPVVHREPRFYVVIRADSAMIGSVALTRCMAALQV